MRKLLKIVGGLVVLAVVLLGGLIGWLSARKPAQRPASEQNSCSVHGSESAHDWPGQALHSLAQPFQTIGLGRQGRQGVKM